VDFETILFLAFKVVVLVFIAQGVLLFFGYFFEEFLDASDFRKRRGI